ncbi:tumor necrosis factor receptor superfamily member 18 [Clarias gariepinus]
MASVKLYVVLFVAGAVLSMCMALECTWKTEYEYKGRCCKMCLSGEYPAKHCTPNNSLTTECKKCPENSKHCFCKNMLCEDNTCSECTSKPTCTQGQLSRQGSYKFSYNCEQAYTDKADNLSKLRNTTPGVNLRCTVNPDKGLRTFNGLVVGLAITGFICLAMLVYIFIQMSREQKMKKKYSSTSNSLNVTSDECICKLSKEEMGEVKPLGFQLHQQRCAV